MSCRVLGRGVERASLAVLAAEARRCGFRTLVGYYLPTAKNQMVRSHYADLGFSQRATQKDGVATVWSLDLRNDIQIPNRSALRLQMLNESAIYERLNEVFRDIFDDESIVLTSETTAAAIPKWEFLQSRYLWSLAKRPLASNSGAELEELRNVGELVQVIRRRLR